MLFVVLRRALRLHVTSKPHKKQRAKCRNELDEGCMGWCATRVQRRDDDAQRPSQPADLKERVHHTSWTYLWACASRILYSHIQTKLTFVCGFSLNLPPPPPHQNRSKRWTWQEYFPLTLTYLDIEDHLHGSHPHTNICSFQWCLCMWRWHGNCECLLHTRSCLDLKMKIQKRK